MSLEQSAVAWQRFGLGARPGDLEGAGQAPITELLAEVANAGAPDTLASLPGSPALFAKLVAFRTQRKTAREAKAVAGTSASEPSPTAPGMGMQGTSAMADTQASMQGRDATAADMQPNPVRDAMLDEIAARLKLAQQVHIGFGERLAMFWANHFTVSGTSEQAHILCGAFEREAIRPHLAGRFADLLAAAEAHPAMLFYLDNERSMGPNSLAGQRRGKGLNENLAREILELHTVGVDGGYTQADVTSFAGAITGWSVSAPQDPEGTPGRFMFRPRMHEPGSKHVLGRDYPQDGMAQGRAILADIAGQHATAQHIAAKLARHFIADEPPKAVVADIAAAFERSGGDLMAVYEAMLKSDGALAKPLTKLRPPREFVFAGIRALGADPEAKRVFRAMTLLGQTPFMAPSPQGWSDDSKAWLAPDAIRTRLELANLIAGPAAQVRPVERAKAVLGPLLSDETLTAIEHAESSRQGLALLLMAPEFQRR